MCIYGEDDLGGRGMTYGDVIVRDAGLCGVEDARCGIGLGCIGELLDFVALLKVGL